MKARTEPWHWSDTEVDPWSRKHMPWSYLVTGIMFLPIGAITGRLIAESERAGNAPILPVMLLAAFFLAMLGFLLTLVIHELGHMVVGVRRGLSLRYVMFFGIVYDAKGRKFIRLPGLSGALAAVMFDRPIENLPAFGAMVRGGVTFNFLTVPVAAVVALAPNLPDLVRAFAGTTALFSFGLGALNTLPFRVSTLMVSDGYYFQWQKQDGRAMQHQARWPQQMQSYFLCPPSEWDLPVLLEKHSAPEDYPIRQILRLMHAQHLGNQSAVGLIIEESLANWPRGRPGNMTGLLLSEAAIFFTQTVDDKTRAKHYELRVRRNLQQPTVELNPLKVIQLVRSGKRNSAEDLIKQALSPLDTLPPALKEHTENRFAAALQSTAPTMTASEWAELRRTALSDA